MSGTVVDEESGGMGALAFVDRGYRADACIMTEATQMKIAPLCRGILWGKVTLTGRSGHIELPQKDWREGGTMWMRSKRPGSYWTRSTG